MLLEGPVLPQGNNRALFFHKGITGANRQYQYPIQLKKNDFPDTPFEDISICLKMFMKRANTILTGRYIRSTFNKDQREFMEHLQIGKQIGKFLIDKHRFC